MWGQMGFPTSFAGHFEDFWSYYQNTNIPPMIAFHGNLDGTLPIDITPLKYAPNKPVQVKSDGTQLDYTPFNSEYHCTLLSSANPFKLDQTTNSIDLYGAGSKGMYDIFHTTAINQSIELYMDCNMSHGVKTVKDSFGLANPASTKDVFKYIVQRAATFFQAVITGKDTLLNSDLFYDWENKRVKSYPNSQLSDNPTICIGCNQPCPDGAAIIDDPDNPTE